MIKLENKQHKTLILKTSIKDISFSSLTLEPCTSKIEVIEGKKNTYLYIFYKE